MDTKLLNILVCPVCRGSLHYDKRLNQLTCSLDNLAYPIRDGIPIMLLDQAHPIQEGK